MKTSLIKILIALFLFFVNCMTANQNYNNTALSEEKKSNVKIDLEVTAGLFSSPFNNGYPIKNLNLIANLWTSRFKEGFYFRTGIVFIPSKAFENYFKLNIPTQVAYKFQLGDVELKAGAGITWFALYSIHPSALTGINIPFSTKVSFTINYDLDFKLLEFIPNDKFDDSV